jgi:hypothetical protein
MKVYPELSKWDLLKNAKSIAKNPVAVMSKYMAQFGDTFYFKNWNSKKSLIASNSDIIRHVLQQNSKNYMKSEIQKENTCLIFWTKYNDC